MDMFMREDRMDSDHQPINAIFKVTYGKEEEEEEECSKPKQKKI